MDSNIPLLSISSPLFFAFAFVFYLASLISFVLPGITLLQAFGLNKAEKWIASFGVGIAAWSLCAYIALTLGWLWMLPLWCFVGLLGVRKKVHSSSFQQLWKEIAELVSTKTAAFLIIVGSVLQLSSVFTTGLVVHGKLSYWWNNVADGMFHASLAEAIVQQFPPQQPGAAGMLVTNYHYWSDMLVASLHMVWGLPILQLLFQFLPLLLSPLYGLLTLAIVKRWSSRKRVWHVALFLLYFSADLVWIGYSILHHGFGAHVDMLDNGIIQHLNPPQAIAKLLWLTSVLLIDDWLRSPTVRKGLVLALTAGVVIGFKVYFGMFMAAILGIIFIGKLLSSIVQKNSAQQTFKLIRIIVFTGALFTGLSLAIFLPPNKHSGGLFYVPLAWPKLFISPEKMNWSDWWLRMQVYEAAGSMRNKIIMRGVLLMFFIGTYFGIKTFGLFAWIPKWREKMPMLLYLGLLVPSVLFAFIGMNFLQSSGIYNTFNFLVLSLSGLSILAAFPLGHLLDSKKWIVKLAILGGLLIMLPRTLYTAGEYAYSVFNQHHVHQFSQDQLQLFRYIRESIPFNTIVQPHDSDERSVSTPYYFFFSERPTYISGQDILRSHNQNIEQRDKYWKFVSHEPVAPSDVLYFLQQQNIRYVVFNVSQQDRLNLHMNALNFSAPACEVHYLYSPTIFTLEKSFGSYELLRVNE